MAQPTEPTLTPRAKWTVSVLVTLALLCNWVPQIDALAQVYLSDTISSNAIVFGIVRTLNGLISIVQSAEVGVGVAGIGLGEIFDPVNDLIERFSGLLLMTLTALGVQQVILLFTTSVALKVVFSVFGAGLLIVLWWREAHLTWWLRIGITFFIVRFLLTMEVGLVWLFDVLYFNATGEQALSVLEASAQVLETLRTSITDINLSELIFGKETPTLDSESIGSRISTSVVTLIVGMLFKSILIPMGTLWGGYKISKITLLHANIR